jgi:hypothetical protein
MIYYIYGNNSETQSVRVDLWYQSSEKVHIWDLSERALLFIGRASEVFKIPLLSGDPCFHWMSSGQCQFTSAFKLLAVFFAARRRHAAEKPGRSATMTELEKHSDLENAIAAAAAAAAALMGLSAVCL